MKKYILLLLFILITFIRTTPNSSNLISENEIKNIKNHFNDNIRKYTLNNGIRIILMKNGISPTIACYLKIGVGSADEPFDIAGSAHFLEHLLFKGSKNIGTNNYELEIPYLQQIEVVGERIDELQRKNLNPLLNKDEIKYNQEQIIKNKKQLQILEDLSHKFSISEEDSKIYSLAGQIGYNAYTNTDVTNYQIQLPKQQLELWAKLESDRFLNPIFRGFYAEREIIQEERKMRFDSNPEGMLYELYLDTAFGMSPYGKPVIGYEDNIPLLKQSEIRKFYNNNYIPSNMVIGIVGDIDFENTLNILKANFEKLPKKEKTEFPPISFKEKNIKKTAVLSLNNTPLILTGWHRPSINHPDSIIFECIDRLLTDGQSSRLVKRLVVDEKIVSNIGADSSGPGEKLNNLYTIIATPFLESDYTKISNIIYEELNKLKNEGPTEEELNKIKYKYYSELINSLDSNHGLAEILTYYEIITNNYKYFFDSIEDLNNIKNTDIKRVIETYFKEEKNTTVWIQKPVQK